MTVLEKPNEFCFAGNKINYIVQSSNELEGVLLLKIGANTIATLNASKYNGKYDFGDMSDVVRAFLNNTFQFQAQFNNLEALKTFSVEIRIKSGSNPDDTFFENFTAITGGLPTEVQYDFWDLQDSQQTLLTLQPSPKDIAFGSFEFLSFANYDWNSDRNRVVKIKYADGSEENQITYLGVNDDNGIETRRVQIGTDILYDTNKKVVWYEVAFNDDSYYETNKQRFVIDYSHRRNQRFFVFENSLGGWDTLRAYGEQDSTANFEQEFANEVATNTFINNVLQVENLTQKVLMNNEHEISTGYHSKKYIAYLREFFLSRQKFLIKGQKAFPITTNNKKIKYADDGNGLKAITFSYQFPKQNAYYHPEMI